MPVERTEDDMANIKRAFAHVTAGSVVEGVVGLVTPRGVELTISVKASEDKKKKKKKNLGKKKKKEDAENGNEDATSTSTLLKAFLPMEHLSDLHEHAAPLARSLKPGDVLKEVLVLKKKETDYSVTVSMKPALLFANKQGLLPASLEHVKIGSKVVGSVKKITPFGVYVHTLNNLTGLGPLHPLRMTSLPSHSQPSAMH